VPENIFRKIDGPFVAQALQTLPNAETSKEDFAETEIDVPLLGRIRFKCQRMTARQGKNRFRFWSAIEAFEVE
jgi:hypothetical protein